MPTPPNRLYYGDNLHILRALPAASVDLVYLDPPFNSNRTYNVLFKEKSGQASAAQLEAFGDTWQWDEAAVATYDALRTGPHQRVGKMMNALKDFIGGNDMMAYLVMMSARLIELHRVLKPTGSLYLHCDPTASHYLKVVLDTIFGKENYRNEIVWQRTIAKALSSRQLPNNHDVLLCYQKTDAATWNADAMFQPYDASNLDEKTASKYTHRDPDGRLYQLDNLINPNPDRPNLTYEFLGVTKVWRWTKGRMQAAYDAGLVVQPRPGAVPRLKRYLDEQRGRPLGDVWTDIPPINSQARERLGYPTQKPLALLERIIAASSNPGDVVLDPFCVTEDTLIVTRAGLRPIQEVQEGDYVLTHTGCYRKVLHRYEREYQGPLLHITRARSNIGIKITPNHPVLAVRAVQCPYDTRRCLPRECHYHHQGRHQDCPRYRDHYKPEWIPAGELRAGDWVYYPATNISAPVTVSLPDSSHYNAKAIPNQLPITPNLMEWLGYFAAEGFVDKNSVHFANYEDAERIVDLGADLFGLTGTIYALSCRSKHIRFNSHALSLWMEQTIGRGAANKRLPEWVFGIDPACRRALLRALLRSDGSFRQDKANDASHSYRYASASPTLAHQVLRLLMDEQIAGSFTKTWPTSAGKMLQGRMIRVNHPSYQVKVYDAVSVNQLLSATQEAPAYMETIIRQPYDSYPFDAGLLYSIKKIETKEAATRVFNLEVEEDHSYVTATFTVHNCGCGTAVVAAQKLGRRWIGIDITHLAIALMRYRLRNSFGDEVDATYKVEGEPEDLESARALAQMSDHDGRYQFQWWALSLVHAQPVAEGADGRGKKGADKGIDGVIPFLEADGSRRQVIVSVKSGHLKPEYVREMPGILEREQAAIGVLITLEPPTAPMRREALAAGSYHSEWTGLHYPKVQILTIEDLFRGEGVRMPPTAQAPGAQAPRIRPAAATQTAFDV